MPLVMLGLEVAPYNFVGQNRLFESYGISLQLVLRGESSSVGSLILP
jgi:hypothetical protein